MKIKGKEKVKIVMKATFKQPYPTAIKKYSIDGKDADLVFATTKYGLEIDGEYYSGVQVCLLYKS